MKFFNFFLIGLIVSANSYADNTAVVLGYQSVITDAVWQQKQLGFGVKNILQQALMDKTTLSFMDEKVVLGFNHKNLDHELQQHWMLQENQLSPNNLQTLANKHQLAYIFWIKIIDFKTEVSKISLAFFSSSKHKDSLELEICRYTLASNSIDCHAGEGTQSRSLNSILYKPMDTVNFNTSGAGQLSKDAIFDARPKVISDEQ